MDLEVRGPTSAPEKFSLCRCPILVASIAVATAWRGSFVVPKMKRYGQRIQTTASKHHDCPRCPCLEDRFLKHGAAGSVPHTTSQRLGTKLTQYLS